MLNDGSQRWKALYQVQRAIEAGKLVRPDTCEICGKQVKHNPRKTRTGFAHSPAAIKGHHWNGYDNPLDVWWLCGRCNTLLAGEYFHSGQVTKEEAQQYVLSFEPKTKPKREYKFRVSKRLSFEERINALTTPKMIKKFYAGEILIG